MGYNFGVPTQLQTNQIVSRLLRDVRAATPERPITPALIYDIRSQVEASLTDEALRLTDDWTSKTVEAVWDIDPEFARKELRRIQDPTLMNPTECWYTSSIAPCGDKGYIKLNWRYKLHLQSACLAGHHRVT